MAFIHEKSTECATTQLDIFAVPMSQTAIESATCIEFHPISNITDGAPIEFNINGTGLDYVDLPNVYLHVLVEIVQGNGESIGNNSTVGPINNFMHSLFSQVDVRLNENLVSSTNNTYAYRALIETLLSYGPAAKESQLQCGLYYKDTAGHMEVNNPQHTQIAATADTPARTEPCKNAGLASRYAHFHGGRVVDLMGKLHTDLFMQERYLLSEVHLRIRLLRNKDAFCLMGPANGQFKVKIRDCRVHIRKPKLSSSAYLSHEKALAIGSANYPIRRVVCKTFTVSAGNRNFTHENVFQGQLPTRLVLGMVDNDAFNGVYNKNPFNFQHYNLKSIKVYLDGQDQNVRPIVTDFSDDNPQYITAYQSLFAATGKLGADEGLDIKRHEYPKGYTLFAFDLTSDLSPDDNHFSLIKTGSLRLDLVFGTELPRTINVIVFSEFESMISIDVNRQVHYDYAT